MLGTTAAVLLALGAGGAAYGVGRMSQPNQQMQAPLPLPQPPSIDASQQKANDITQKKRAAMTQTIFTSPLGVSGQAQVAQKMLLGQ